MEFLSYREERPLPRPVLIVTWAAIVVSVSGFWGAFVAGILYVAGVI